MLHFETISGPQDKQIKAGYGISVWFPVLFVISFLMLEERTMLDIRPADLQTAIESIPMASSVWNIPVLLGRINTPPYTAIWLNRLIKKS
ncbi:hypothetical protein GXP67_12310 [Rhodocytophaga rosea]|uniref:Uncharacterized protein n=1 Tax=Rhodocytophaga rosea TaxID=2704465 RepID=A0A6C0GH32_9BACT|nr:hypothetical protein [Rhodocytophaga rosea]QHT67361.1 hypothetical protein GXP67_12310 [Rhodocytophaga rosea]